MSFKFSEYKKICCDIYNCDKCSFYKELSSHVPPIPFHPDYPLACKSTVERLGGYRIVLVGINPGWNDDLRNKSLEALGAMFPKDFDQHFHRKVIDGLYGGKTSYFGRITDVVNFANERLKILSEGDIEPNGENDKKIKTIDILRYALWCNLSFCNSPGTKGSRIFSKNIKVSCRVYSEEIPKCLAERYVERFLKLFVPELVIVFSSSHRLDYENVLRCLGLEKFDAKKFDFQANKKGTRFSLIAARGEIVKKRSSVLFVPHPNSFRFIRSIDDFFTCLSLSCNYLLG